VVTGPLDGYLARRESLIATAAPGGAAAQELSDLTDEAVSALAGAASSTADAPFAVFALGGYGARRLLPHSDIDLLVVTRGTGPEARSVAEALFYPLWDSGLEIGHQVRGPKEQAASVRDDINNLTAFLSARLIAGDPDLAQATLELVFKRIHKEARRALAEIAQRERPGSPYLLEPDLKGGAGGQRDIDEMVWRSVLGRHSVGRRGGHAAGAGGDAGALGAIELLGPGRQALVADAQETLTAGRWLLHRAAGRGDNVMTTEAAAEAGIDAEAVQRALEVVHHALLGVRDGANRRTTPAPEPITLGALDAASRRGPEAVADLERAAFAGSFDHAIPGFRELMCVRRPALSHRFTVGAHCVRVLTSLSGSGPTGGSVTLAPDYLAPLLVAALAHDIAKRDPEPGHAARSAPVAEAIARRLGLQPAVAARAGVLVREHLLLSEVSTSADLADEDVVLAAAARVGDRELVTPLYLLTAADMRATGPGVWNAWRTALTAELALKIENALSPEIDGAGVVAAAETTRAEATRMAMAEGASRAVLDFCRAAPLRYLARRSPDHVLRDARLVQLLAGPGPAGEVAFGITPGPAPETWRIDVVTRDKPGLFAVVSGALALAGLNALSAEAFTERSGIALDTFTVASATLASVDSSTWNRFEQYLHGALGGHFDLETRLAERRSHYRVPVGGDAAGCSVSFGPRGSFTTAVQVTAPDRVGLLHDLARAFGQADLDIRRATITTAGTVASDAFEVAQTSDGEAPDAATLQLALAPLLEAATLGRNDS